MSMSVEDRAKLVALARAGLEAEVLGKPFPPAQGKPTGVLGERLGCFVTLTNQGRLRGCIGTFRPARPLGETIPQMGRSAAKDPRFVGNPITPQELPRMTVEVSILSPLERTDEPENLRIGTHGIYIVRGTRSGCFLPHVATETGWNVEEFLSNCCTHKAGLPADAWRQSDTEVYLFTSEIFDH